METKSEYSVFSAINSKTGKELTLAMQELMLTGRLLPVGASLQVRHVFQCAEQKPVEVVYAFGLPRDAALRRFRIVGKGFSVMSELKPTAEAVKMYEEGIEAGSLSSLARQYRDGVVNLNVGNIRPGEMVAVYLEILAGVELRDDGLRFRFPFTLAPTYHAKTKSIEVEPGTGEMELPEEFGDVILPRWMQDATGLHRVGFELTVAVPQAVAEIGSPSHAIKVRHETDGQHRVSLAPEKDVPDRDLVLDIRTQAEIAGVTGGIGKDGTGHFAVVVPSSAFGKTEVAPKRIVFVIDRSGSMQGAPIAQARQAVEACLGALSKADAFGVVAFDDKVECLAERLMNGTKERREEARKFLAAVDARGGTELATGFLAAAKMLGKDGGDVLVLTDGQVSGTETILAKARTAGIRIHCLGIGSASQDRFLTLLARETGGVSRFLTARERVDMAAVELFASIGSPVARGVRVEADGITFAPELPPAIFAGTPLVLFGETDGKTDGQIWLTWEGGKLKAPVKLEQSSEAETIRLLQGSRLITDMEARMDSVGETDCETTRQNKALEELSTKYGLASRAMSLVAVVKRKGDKPGDLPETMVVPVGMPQDTEFGAYFSGGAMLCEPVGSYLAVPAMVRDENLPPQFSIRRGIGAGSSDFVLYSTEEERYGAEDLLLRLAALIELDGGMPGKDDEERWVATAVALCCFLAEGHTATVGAFRLHVARLLGFLRAAPSTATDERKRRLLEQAELGFAPAGDWTKQARALLAGKPITRQNFWRAATVKQGESVP